MCRLRTAVCGSFASSVGSSRTSLHPRHPLSFPPEGRCRLLLSPLRVFLHVSSVSASSETTVPPSPRCCCCCRETTYLQSACFPTLCIIPKSYIITKSSHRFIAHKINSARRKVHNKLNETIDPNTKGSIPVQLQRMDGKQRDVSAKYAKVWVLIREHYIFST